MGHGMTGRGASRDNDLPKAERTRTRTAKRLWKIRIGRRRAEGLKLMDFIFFDPFGSFRQSFLGWEYFSVEGLFVIKSRNECVVIYI